MPFRLNYRVADGGTGGHYIDFDPENHPDALSAATAFARALAETYCGHDPDDKGNVIGERNVGICSPGFKYCDEKLNGYPATCK